MCIRDSVYTIDWSQTRAIQSRSSYIYINLKGRDPEGIVEPADYEALREKIIDDLYAYRDPVHGRRVVAFAMTMEAVSYTHLGFWRSSLRPFCLSLAAASVSLKPSSEVCSA